MACLLTVGCRLARLLSESDNILPSLEKKNLEKKSFILTPVVAIWFFMTGVGNYYLAITL